MLFKVINLFNRKQTMYHFEIAEGKKKFLLRTQILQQKDMEKRRNQEALNQETK